MKLCQASGHFNILQEFLSESSQPTKQSFSSDRAKEEKKITGENSKEQKWDEGEGRERKERTPQIMQTRLVKVFRVRLLRHSSSVKTNWYLACVASVTVAFFAKNPIFAVLDAREMGREQKPA